MDLFSQIVDWARRLHVPIISFVSLIFIDALKQNDALKWAAQYLYRSRVF